MTWLARKRLAMAEGRRRRRHNRRRWPSISWWRFYADALEDRILGSWKRGDGRCVTGLLLRYLSEATGGADVRDVIDASQFGWVDPNEVQGMVASEFAVPLGYLQEMRSVGAYAASIPMSERGVIDLRWRVDSRRFATSRFFAFLGKHGGVIYGPP